MYQDSPRGQFYERARNGDVVLVLPASKTVILYRPETNEIIDVVTIMVESPPDVTPVPTTVQDLSTDYLSDTISTTSALPLQL